MPSAMLRAAAHACERLEAMNASLREQRDREYRLREAATAQAQKDRARDRRVMLSYRRTIRLLQKKKRPIARGRARAARGKK